jgi:hypothetical protein
MESNEKQKLSQIVNDYWKSVERAKRYKNKQHK